MARKLFLVESGLADVSNHNATLSEWIETVSTFHVCYTHLSSYLIEKKSLFSKQLPHGQCPMDQIRLLLSAMQSELIKLTHDLDQDDPTRLGRLSELAAHTRALDRLNKRAQVMLLLITFTTS